MMIRIISMLFFISLIAITYSCKQQEAADTEEHPQELVGKWKAVKKEYSNGLEDVYQDDDDVYYLNNGGKLKRDYRDHRKEIRNEQGEWKILSRKSPDGKNDTLYFIKRTPLFNGIFEERFRILSKSDKEMILEEGSWGFEKDNNRDKIYLVKAE